MSEQVDTGANQHVGIPTPSQAEAATQRAALMANPAWREQAISGKGAAWEQLTALNRALAPADDDAVSGDHTLLPPKGSKFDDATSYQDLDADPEAAPDGFYSAPESAAAYRLPTDDARRQGLEVDAQGEIAIRQAFHAAEVSQPLAAVLYMSAIHEAKADASQVGQESARIHCERDLRKQWPGETFDQNLALAQTEARRVFAGMPHTLTQGATFEDWVEASGLGNSRQVVLALYRQAKARRPA